MAVERLDGKRLQLCGERAHHKGALEVAGCPRGGHQGRAHVYAEDQAPGRPAVSRCLARRERGSLDASHQFIREAGWTVSRDTRPRLCECMCVAWLYKRQCPIDVQHGVGKQHQLLALAMRCGLEERRLLCKARIYLPFGPVWPHVVHDFDPYSCTDCLVSH